MIPDRWGIPLRCGHYAVPRVLVGFRRIGVVVLALSCLLTEIHASAQVVTAGPRRPARRGRPRPTIDDIVASLQGLPIAEFLDESFRQLQLRDPDALVYNGVSQGFDLRNDRFTELSDRFLRQTQELELAILDLLRTYDRESVPPDQVLSRDVYEWYLGSLVDGHRFAYHDLPVNGYGTWDRVNRLVHLMVSYLPLKHQRDAEDYIARLSKIDTWVDQIIQGLELREDVGNVPPRPLLENAILWIEYHIQMQGPDSFDIDSIELYVVFGERLLEADSIGPDQRSALLAAARAEIEGTVIPAFLRLREHLVYLEGIASDDVGLWRLAEGDAYYVYLLNRYTGANVSPDAIHEMGSARVADLQSRMQLIASGLGYSPEITMAEINQILSDNANTLEGDELLAEYRRLLVETELAANDFFNLRPSAPVIITYDPSAPIGYYQPPPLDGSGPGAMVTNLQSPGSVSLYNPTVLLHHETIPGHHMQLALALDLQLPVFRNTITSDIYYGKDVPFQGYVEGWAVYAQQLGQEMGLYEGNPMEDLGRLRLMLHQVARMVVDTGIHAKRWTREQAATYLEQATGVPASARQMNRYVAVPGQAIGFNYGALTILELRQRARDQLGERFDIKQFHDVVLGNGPMPIGLLEQVVEDWIEAQRKRHF
jgi:uncharacterized protein (DUF885 family)